MKDVLRKRSVYSVKKIEQEGQQDKTFFNRIGVAYYFKDGTEKLEFDSFPVRHDGTIEIWITDKQKGETNHERITD